MRINSLIIMFRVEFDSINAIVVLGVKIKNFVCSSDNSEGSATKKLKAFHCGISRIFG